MIGRQAGAAKPSASPSSPAGLSRARIALDEALGSWAAGQAGWLVGVVSGDDRGGGWWRQIRRGEHQSGRAAGLLRIYCDGRRRRRCKGDRDRDVGT